MAVDVRGQRLPLKTYTVADGLAHDTVFAIHSDRHGYLWFSTREGLSRFDGAEFITYNFSGKAHASAHDVVDTGDGIYWIATTTGVIRFDGGARTAVAAANNRIDIPAALLRPFSSPDAKSRFVITVTAGRDGSIWCGTAGGLVRIDPDGGSTAAQPIDIGLPKNVYDVSVQSILEDRDGSLWLGTKVGLYHRYSGGRVEHFTTARGLPADNVQTLLQDRRGRIWVGTTLGLCLMQRDKSSTSIQQCFTVADGLAGPNVRSLLETSDGTVWAGTVGGLSQWQGESELPPRFRSYTIAHGLSDSTIEALAEDRDGNLWVGTESVGVMKIAPGGFSTYREVDGLTSSRIASIFEDQRGRLCVVSGDVVHVFDGTRWNAHRYQSSKARRKAGWGWFQIHFQDHLGGWWIPTAEGLMRFPRGDVERLERNGPLAIYTARDGLPTDQIFRLFEDSRGDVWISTVDGIDSLVRWERATNRFRAFTVADGLPSLSGLQSRVSQAPTAFAEDRAGNIWIGFFEGGLARYRQGKFERFGPADGVPGGSIRGMLVDSRGRLWVAATREGVGRIDDPAAVRLRIKRYSIENGLSSNQALALTEDRQGRIYVGTGRGVDQLDVSSGRSRRFSVVDGLANNFVNVAYCDKQGTLWFGTLQGLSRYSPAPQVSHPPGLTVIKSVSVDGQARPLAAIGEADVTLGELAPEDNLLQISFLTVTHRSGHFPRYQFRLDGADREWSPATDQRSVTLANLAPGAYRFRVRTVEEEGTIEPRSAAVAFTILRPIWQRWWFLALMILLLGTAIYTAYDYRLRRLLELERVRTRIASDLHDDIGASLSRIAILSEVLKGEDRWGSSQRLGQIADSARELVDSMADIVWSVDPRRDDLRNVIERVRQFAGGVLEARTIAWSLEVPPAPERVRMTPEQRRHLLMFFKEAINNVVRHAGCSTVWLSIALSRDHLIAVVRDDGRGFDPKQDERPARGGHGLPSMRRRAEELGGTFEVRSGADSGTTLEMRIPVGA